ncbi:thermolysin metallopeptidase family protein [Marinobacter santoriniensis NKSG1]|uniref:Thermolysin metallopeptidase family protein n=1 Tax=Marinobacter santoriniensis NKSG1 TaxID=1288826 RepID=M7CQX9_9GAMM|nr:thermolysin metallopeptidase family protein [Marinobacter santoriniensis]EMP55574.1 thermolysin metallopeptidase family protein [Marinobacter santoriniensis NKSG1]
MRKSLLVLSVTGFATFVTGCATQNIGEGLEKLPPTSAGQVEPEIIVDNEDPSFFSKGPWVDSTATPGFYGKNYRVIAAGAGDSSAVWNLETIKPYDVFVRWSAYTNRASNAKYSVYYIDDSGKSAVDVVTVDQRLNGGDWVKLGTYLMSSLQGRVELSDAANGYVVADAVRFVPVDTRSLSADSDQDGMTDAFETKYGLNVNDPSDALGDLDGDGITNLEEQDLQTDPTSRDTDGDGMDDGYEVTYGLNPNVDDASLDLDGDGYTNIDEYYAASDPNDVNSLPGAGPLISWSAPTRRADGSVLDPSEIDHYEIRYFPAYSSEALTIDDSSGYFEMVGANVGVSSHTPGYLGDGYHPIPPGDGTVFARWSFFELTPSTPYGVEVRWTSDFNRSKRVTYRVQFTGNAGDTSVASSPIDQTISGGQWVEVAQFTPTDPSAQVELPSQPDGYVIADAVRLIPNSEPIINTVTVPGSKQTVRLEEDLSGGQWTFQVRAVDQNGAASAFSEPLTVNFP